MDVRSSNVTQLNPQDGPSAAGSLSDELTHARRLAAALNASLDTLAQQLPADDEASDLVRRVRALIQSRRRRETLFPSEWFGDPVWDILLELFLADLEGRSVSISSICIASAVAPTTALRWINRLSDDGPIVRDEDPGESRRVNVRLTDSAREKMRRFMALTEAAGVDRTQDGALPGPAGATRPIA